MHYLYWIIIIENQTVIIFAESMFRCVNRNIQQSISHEFSYILRHGIIRIKSDVIHDLEMVEIL